MKMGNYCAPPNGWNWIAVWPAWVGLLNGQALKQVFRGRSDRRGFLLPHERPDPIGVRGGRRVVDHHAQIGPAIDRKGRIFERQRAENRVSYVLDALAMAADGGIAPHCFELGAEPAELVDERLHLRRGPRTGRVHPERPVPETGPASPAIPHSTAPRLAADYSRT